MGGTYVVQCVQGLGQNLDIVQILGVLISIAIFQVLQFVLLNYFIVFLCIICYHWLFRHNNQYASHTGPNNNNPPNMPISAPKNFLTFPFANPNSHNLLPATHIKVPTVITIHRLNISRKLHVIYCFFGELCFLFTGLSFTIINVLEYCYGVV